MFLYMRMILIVLVSLYTARVVLRVLGESDYGTYNLVADAVLLFGFISTAMVQATQRFLNYSIGLKDDKLTNRIFCMSMNTYAILSVILIILAETVGLWFVNTKLNIPSERMVAANWCYQFAVVAFVITLLRISHTALLVAYERLSIHAYIGVLEAVEKLLVVYLISGTTYDKLILYALLYTLVPLINNLIIFIYNRCHFAVSEYHLIWDMGIFRKLFSFSSWSLLGSSANMLAQKGINILLNIFYGVTLNAAVSIANQVTTNVYAFISNFQVAFNPQIVKSYAVREIDRFNDLIFKTSKYSYFLLLILSLPVMFSMQQVLDIWLEEVPMYTAGFCQLMFGFLLIEALSAPMWMAVQATGDIKVYQILIALCVVLNFPLGYLVLCCGWSVYSVWIVRVLLNVVAFVTRCLYLKKRVSFPLRDYCREVISPVLLVTVVSLLIPIIINITVDQYWYHFFSIIVGTFVSTLIVVALLGMSNSERQMVRNLLLSKFVRNN
ncbi:MAG: lipopolysaccharide biosynthesis protein [Marinilabiliaceae bacterium]|nr:lipopolysaccharide biosynthesis protein [Marinilabiliaceae bacterium]